MRISDWSSDVCSSDLPVIRTACGMRTLISSATGGLSPFFAGCDMGIFYLLRARPNERSLAKKLSSMNGIRSGTDSRTPRSEEHTSELQSLMRISYAVFCLKKKKEKKQKRN